MFDYPPAVPSPSAPRNLNCLVAASIASAIAATQHAPAQTEASATAPADAVQSVAGPATAKPSTTSRTIDGTTLGGFVLPTQPIAGDCKIGATRGWVWKSDDTQRLLLEGDVRVALGGYTFSSKRASVWINRLPYEGSAVTQIAVWFDRADEPTRRAGLGASGKDLLVTATIRGTTELSLTVTERNSPAQAQAPSPAGTVGDDTAAQAARRKFLAAGETRLSRYLRGLTASIASGTQRAKPRATIDAITKPADVMPVPGGSLAAAANQVALPDSITIPELAGRSTSIFEPSGTVSFSADSIVADQKADRICIQGSVEIEYRAPSAAADRTLLLSAERSVIFLKHDALATLQSGGRSLDASSVEGIYLEGAVQASDGEYALRGAQVYYDLKTNRASIVDAVLRTYDRKRRDLPIYVRAAELRQVAADEWTAERATVSTSEFFTPHLAIGVDRVTVTKQPDIEGGGVYVDAQDAAFEAGGNRIFPLPGYEGRVERLPVRSLETGYDEDRGVEFGSTWDLAALTGMAPIEGADSTLQVDGFSERGAAVGTTFKLNDSLSKGKLELYGLYDTGGNDRTSSGELVPIDSGARGIIDSEWQSALSSTTTVKTQFSYISDETFVSAWRERDFDNRREYESSVALERTSANSSLSLLMKHDLNDFISNSYLLASRGYTVDKLPEFAYRRFGDMPFEGLTWSQNWSASLMRLRPTTGTPAQLGVPTGAWGGVIGAQSPIDQAYDSAGYSDNSVARFDSRQELAIPMANDWVTVTPFVAGEATGYAMNELTQYTADVDSMRLQANGGVRSSMRFVRVDNDVQSRLFDLNRMRHIVEPYGTLWYGWDSLDPGALPVYDQDFEGTSAGTAANLGVKQTFQTQRGGTGAWQSVDWLKLDMGLVLNQSDDNFTPQPVDQANPFSSLRWSQSPIPAFYSFRPELSQWGSHAYGNSSWQLSDSLTLGGTANYLLEDRDFVTDDGSVMPNLARASIGLEMRHNPVVSTYLEYRYLAPTSTELMQAGVLYRVGKRYLLAFSPQYDLQAGEMRAVSGSLTRTFPDFDMHGNAGYDLIEDRTFVGISLSIPAGARTGANTFGAYNPTMGSSSGSSSGSNAGSTQ